MTDATVYIAAAGQTWVAETTALNAFAFRQLVENETIGRQGNGQVPLPVGIWVEATRINSDEQTATEVHLTVSRMEDIVVQCAYVDTSTQYFGTQISEQAYRYQQAVKSSFPLHLNSTTPGGDT